MIVLLEAVEQSLTQSVFFVCFFSHAFITYYFEP